MPVDMRTCARDVGNGVGTTYDTEFEVYADGYHFKLVDPYSTPRLYIRQPGVTELGESIPLRPSAVVSDKPR